MPRRRLDNPAVGARAGLRVPVVFILAQISIPDVVPEIEPGVVGDNARCRAAVCSREGLGYLHDGLASVELATPRQDLERGSRIRLPPRKVCHWLLRFARLGRRCAVRVRAETTASSSPSKQQGRALATNRVHASRSRARTRPLPPLLFARVSWASPFRGDPPAILVRRAVPFDTCWFGLVDGTGRLGSACLGDERFRPVDEVALPRLGVRCHPLGRHGGPHFGRSVRPRPRVYRRLHAAASHWRFCRARFALRAESGSLSLARLWRVLSPDQPEQSAVRPLALDLRALVFLGLADRFRVLDWRASGPLLLRAPDRPVFQHSERSVSLPRWKSKEL